MVKYYIHQECNTIDEYTLGRLVCSNLNVQIIGKFIYRKKSGHTPMTVDIFEQEEM
mgnify:CR=1 FL=1